MIPGRCGTVDFHFTRTLLQGPDSLFGCGSVRPTDVATGFPNLEHASTKPSPARGVGASGFWWPDSLAVDNQHGGPSVSGCLEP